MAMIRCGLIPLWSSITSWYSPEASLNQHTDLPSGDHAGSRSAEPLERVRLRVSPFSAGSEKISPRASTSTRLPLGEISRLVIRPATSSQCGIIHGKSPAAVMSSACSRLVLGSSTWMTPACSKTTAPAPASSVFTSKSVK